MALTRLTILLPTLKSNYIFLLCFASAAVTSAVNAAFVVGESSPEATVLLQLQATLMINATGASASEVQDDVGYHNILATAAANSSYDAPWATLGLRYLPLAQMFASTRDQTQGLSSNSEVVNPLHTRRAARPAGLRRVTEIALMSAAAVFVLYGVGVTAGRRCALQSAQEERLVDSVQQTCCFLGLVVSFGWYGVVQEYIMTSEYRGELFPSAVFLVFVNRIFIIMLSSFILLVRGVRPSLSGLKWTALPSITNCISSYCQQEALLYVTFPVASVFKSCKIVPTMLVNTFMNGQRHNWRDYSFAIFITLCVVGFSLSTDVTSHAPENNAVAGVAMMILFLLCDAMTSNGQKHIYSSYHNIGHVEMMFCVGIFSFCYTGVAVHFFIGFPRIFAFLSKNPESVSHVIELAVSTTAGQYLMFYVIQQNGPVSLAIMMTVRQVFSIVVSSVLFDHPLGHAAGLCAAATLVAVILQAVQRQSAQATTRSQNESKKDMATTIDLRPKALFNAN